MYVKATIPFYQHFMRIQGCSLFSLNTEFLLNLPFPKQKILDSSKLKEFAGQNFKFHDNGKKFPKRVENTVGKGEIARYEQFLLFPKTFQKIRVCIYQQLSRTFFVFFSKICKLECNTTSDWLNRMVKSIRSSVTFICF